MPFIHLFFQNSPNAIYLFIFQNSPNAIYLFIFIFSLQKKIPMAIDLLN